MGAEAAVIAAIVGTALSVGSTAYSLSKGGPDLPEAPKPPAPPPAPPPVEEPPPPPVETQEAVGEERRRRAKRFGVAQTLLTDPLGGGEAGRMPRGSSLLGG